jgi:hypothetical protein
VKAPLAEVLDLAREGQAEQIRVHRDNRLAPPLIAGVNLETPSQGGLGLFVTEGHVSFRWVKLEPLPE